MKLVLKEVKVYKYKCFLNEQKVAIDPKTTTIVGMNESGKTSFLSAIAKTNYFDDSDNDFKFDTTHDYPRNELIDFEDDEDDEGKIVSCTYVIPKELIEQINKELEVDVFNITEFTHNSNYRNSKITLSGIRADDRAFIEHLSKNYELSEPTKKVISELKSIDKVSELKAAEEDTGLSAFKAEIAKYANNPTGWNNLGHHIYITYIRPAMPKFWYFDDYYPLSGKININKMSTSQEMTEQDKTARALFELAKIKPQDVLTAQTNEYERFVALLEASANKITKEVFKFWTTNTNLDIEFKIQEIKNAQNQSEKYLDIRVKSQRHKITLPLDRRRKGFNWFFSFIVWSSLIIILTQFIQ